MPPAAGEVRRLPGEQAVPGGEGSEPRAAVCPEFTSTFRTYVRTVSIWAERRPQELSGRIALAFFSAKMARRSGDWLSALSSSWEPQL